MRGSRVQSVINELQGEKIDIIPWSENPATLMVSALSPAEVSKVVIDEENNRIEAVIAEDQLSLAIGRGGQNVRLASSLLGWSIDILTEEDESNRRTEEFNRLSEKFVSALNIEDIMAHLLVTEGFEQVEEVAYVDLSEIASIEGFDIQVAEELQGRAKEYLLQKESQNEDILNNLNIEQSLKELEGLSIDNLIKLGENSISKLEDLADLSRDEFKGLIQDSGLKDVEIDGLILSSREKSGWFDN